MTQGLTCWGRPGHAFRQASAECSLRILRPSHTSPFPSLSLPLTENPKHFICRVAILHIYGPAITFSFACMYALQFSFTPRPKTLKPSAPPPLHILMKDRPPPSCVSRYIPPHHRLRSAVTSSASPNLNAASLDSTSRDHQGTLLNPRNTSLPHSQPQKLQQKDNSLYDFLYEEVSEEGSDREIESSSHGVSLIHLLVCEFGVGLISNCLFLSSFFFFHSLFFF